MFITLFSFYIIIFVNKGFIVITRKVSIFFIYYILHYFIFLLLVDNLIYSAVLGKVARVKRTVYVL